MALFATHNNIKFGVGDRVKVKSKFKEQGKTRSQVFDGVVIAIKGEGNNKTFTVRRIGVQQVGVERIYPLYSPSIEDIEVVRKGTKGTRRAKLYYLRKKSKKMQEEIYSRALRKSLKTKPSKSKNKKPKSKKNKKAANAKKAKKK